MADVTSALGDAGISLSAISQHETEGQIVPVVITTHLASEGEDAESPQGHRYPADHPAAYGVPANQ